MIKKNIIIIGAGQMGELVSNIILRDGKFNILGFIDKKKTKKINGYKILGNDSFLYNKKVGYPSTEGLLFTPSTYSLLTLARLTPCLLLFSNSFQGLITSLQCPHHSA